MSSWTIVAQYLWTKCTKGTSKQRVLQTKRCYSKRGQSDEVKLRVFLSMLFASSRIPAHVNLMANRALADGKNGTFVRTAPPDSWKRSIHGGALNRSDARSPSQIIENDTRGIAKSTIFLQSQDEALIMRHGALRAASRPRVRSISGDVWVPIEFGLCALSTEAQSRTQPQLTLQIGRARRLVVSLFR